MTESHSADCRGGEEGRRRRLVQIWKLSAPKPLTAQNQLMLPQSELLFAIRDQTRARNPEQIGAQVSRHSLSRRKRFDPSTFLLPPFVTHLHPAPPSRFALRPHYTSILATRRFFNWTVCALLFPWRHVEGLRASLALVLAFTREHVEGLRASLALSLRISCMHTERPGVVSFMHLASSCTHTEGQEPPRTELYHQIKLASRFRSNFSVCHESKLMLLLKKNPQKHKTNVKRC